ncbi:MAG TPA: methyltransferase domain-containing protein [Steroidobacteraceae bacterium]|nr:methyltransferase domain-containing protein [Steroidobacteraceae bacterium]
MPQDATANNNEQIAYWNAVAGLTWAELQSVLDRQIDPLGREAQRALAARDGERILDVGCGCGQTSLELAAQVGRSGAVVAVDVSRPMLEVARARQRASAALPLEFREVDAQSEAFVAGSFDAAYSRFGVMFFADPIAAFANIRHALKPGGRLCFVCWRPLADNQWMRVPLDAAHPYLPAVAPPDPHAPGPFAFADATRVRGILVAAGFVDVRIDPWEAEIGGTDLEDAVKLACRIGPLGAAMRERPDLMPVIGGAVREALARHLRPTGVWMAAAVWIVRALSGVS